ncbi:MAG: SPFH domain-containing protein [Oscillospiraceae bacterium]|nr:SPFH domain-containing protein [Oscillospiraceae bacterium]
MRTSGVSIFDIDEHLDEFSRNLKAALIPDFDEYGISLERFFVTNVLKPDGDRQYEKFKDLHFPQYADAYSYKYMWKYTD